MIKYVRAICCVSVILFALSGCSKTDNETVEITSQETMTQTAMTVKEETKADNKPEAEELVSAVISESTKATKEQATEVAAYEETKEAVTAMTVKEETKTEAESATDNADKVLPASTKIGEYRYIGAARCPILSEFNTVGLNPESKGYFSLTNDKKDEFYREWHNANAWLTSQYTTDGHMLVYESESVKDMLMVEAAYIKRYPSEGFYIFGYKENIGERESGAGPTRIKHRFLLSAITSNPEELEKVLYNTMWHDDDTKQDVGFDKKKWTRVGDCEVRFYYRSSGVYHYQFAIRPAKE